ncbi:MAG: exodeoxyribonuclease VII large subunit [Candidatus Zixiibacteriota bacterium]
MPGQPKPYTVTAITRIIKSTLEDRLSQICVEGEISNYLHHTSGHRYLSLKDERATLKVTIWRSAGASLKFEPENGLKVVAFGDISVYEKGGNYQLNCRRLTPAGMGELELAFRQLHDKLQAEGLFEDDRKKSIPQYCRRIGIVTSPTGAAIRDIIQIAKRRNDAVELFVFPAQVQGDGAENTIAAGIEYFNSRDDIDAIITGRGGGSLEDLWPFNTEVTVRAIAASRIPVISAVGHEIDRTLSDCVADKRAPTPSAAAELVVWSKKETLEGISWQVRQQAMLLTAVVENGREIIGGFLARPVFARPLDIVDQRRQHLDSLWRVAAAAGKNCFDGYRNRLSLSVARLDAMSPLKILGRGYSVTRKIPGETLVGSIGDVQSGDSLETLLTNGRIISTVERAEEQQR